MRRIGLIDRQRRVVGGALFVVLSLTLLAITAGRATLSNRASTRLSPVQGVSVVRNDQGLQLALSVPRGPYFRTELLPPINTVEAAVAPPEPAPPIVEQHVFGPAEPLAPVVKGLSSADCEASRLSGGTPSRGSTWFRRRRSWPGPARGSGSARPLPSSPAPG